MICVQIRVFKGSRVRQLFSFVGATDGKIIIIRFLGKFEGIKNCQKLNQRV